MKKDVLISDLPTPHQLTEEEMQSMRDAGHKYIDGWAVTRSVYDFANSLRKTRAFYQCKFCPTAINIYKNVPSTGLYVYFPDEIYCRGAVGFGDVGVNAFVQKFYVYSQNIANKKIREKDYRHRIAASEDISRAVRLAKQYLREYTSSQIARITSDSVGLKLIEEKSTVWTKRQNAMDDLKNQLTPESPLVQELRWLIDNNHKFVDPAVGNKLKEYIDSISMEKDVYSRNVLITMVCVTNDSSRILTKSLSGPVKLAQINTLRLKAALVNAPEVIYTKDTLPESIKLKVSSLSILEAEQYVDGLGIRTNSNVYYIAEDYVEGEEE